VVIEVSLDPDAEQPVIVSPDPTEIQGPTTVIWQIAKKSPVQDFYFFPESLEFSIGSGFINKQIKDHRCVVYDTWTSKGDFAYVLMVEHEGKYYSTGSVRHFQDRRPCIRNK
jgi:hypothetical protein